MFLRSTVPEEAPRNVKGDISAMSSKKFGVRVRRAAVGTAIICFATSLILCFGRFLISDRPDVYAAIKIMTHVAAALITLLTLDVVFAVLPHVQFRHTIVLLKLVLICMSVWAFIVYHDYWSSTCFAKHESFLWRRKWSSSQDDCLYDLLLLMLNVYGLLMFAIILVLGWTFRNAEYLESSDAALEDNAQRQRGLPANGARSNRDKATIRADSRWRRLPYFVVAQHTSSE